MDKKGMLENLLTTSESASDAYCNALKDDNRLFALMATDDVYRWYDWKESVAEDLFLAFVSERAKKLTDCTLNLEAKSATSLFRMLNKNQQEGDWLPFLFKYYDKLLRQHQLGIIFLDQEDDSYTIFVVKRENISKLIKIKSLFWRFKSIVQNNK